jgi:phage terminase large subunit
MTTITFLPHQKQFVECTDTEVILSGGYGSGKSLSLCAKIVWLSLRYPHNRGFLCRKTLQSLKTSTLKTLLDGDGDLPPMLPKKYIKSHNKTDRVITLINGSEILYGNMDIEYVKSTNLGWAAVDEATELNEEEWNALIGRLRLASVPVRQVFGSTNPNSPTHWIYIRAVENEQTKKKIKFIQSKTTDNKYLPKEYLEELQRTLFGHFYLRFFSGQWVGSGKLVYDNFDPKTHIIKNFDIPEHWKRYRSIDFGFQSPFSCLWIAQAGNDAERYNLKQGDLVVYRELYYTQRTVGVNAEQIIKFSKLADGVTPEKITATISDWDSGDRADLESKGIRTIKADKDISSGIQKTREWLGNTDGSTGPLVRPRLYFFMHTLCENDPKIKYNLQTGERINNPAGIIEEMQTYSWKTRKIGEEKEEPEDKYNHALDALRYFIKHYDGKKLWTEIEFRSL